ncbi:hypothetical protein SUS17_2230 [Sphingomonas sp. S17]|nr:hypothetical protein SUS17_2230 [Sphingomonas sp. S17]
MRRQGSAWRAGLWHVGARGGKGARCTEIAFYSSTAKRW